MYCLQKYRALTFHFHDYVLRSTELMLESVLLYMYTWYGVRACLECTRNVMHLFEPLMCVHVYYAMCVQVVIIYCIICMHVHNVCHVCRAPVFLLSQLTYISWICVCIQCWYITNIYIGWQGHIKVWPIQWNMHRYTYTYVIAFDSHHCVEKHHTCYTLLSASVHSLCSSYPTPGGTHNTLHTT